jgi:hypothetical protein
MFIIKSGKTNLKFLLIIIILAGFAAGAILRSASYEGVFFRSFQPFEKFEKKVSEKNKKNKEGGAPTNFEECAAKGYSVLESYPRQCRIPEGAVFVEKIQPR